MPAGADAVTLAQEAQPEAEVRVVVHRVDLERALELLAAAGNRPVRK